MAFNLKDKISDLNDAMYPQPNKNDAGLLGVFGGQSVGFAKGVDEIYSKTFYQTRTKADSATVAKGNENTEYAASLANKYALFNFQGFYGNLSKSQASNFSDEGGGARKLMGGENAHNVTIPRIINYFDET